MNIISISETSLPVAGGLTLSGAKNSALKVLTASTLSSDEVILDNIPLDMSDVRIKLKMLGSIGADVREERPGRVRLSWPDAGPRSYVSGEFGSIRTSLLFLGALLGRNNKASVPLPGGCELGERKYDLHLMALRQLNAHCTERAERLDAWTDGLSGASIEFPFRTTGGTENAVLAAVCASGRTTLSNAHTRPELFDLANFLNTLGARISIPGSGLVEIEGVKHLRGGHYRIIYDNMEAMTFATFAAITRGAIRIRYFPEQDMEIPMIHLRESGVRFTRHGDTVLVEGPDRIAPFDLSTGTFPGINSDMQPLFTALATQARGKSRITDIRFANRFNYVRELQKMGANIVVEGNSVIVKGPTKLHGARVIATDLRGGAALVAAALAAVGETIIERGEQIDRGYENFGEKLSQIGIRINRVEVR